MAIACGVCAPEGTLTPALRAELSERKAELISFLRQANVTTTATSIGSAPISRDGTFPSLLNSGCGSSTS